MPIYLFLDTNCSLQSMQQLCCIPKRIVINTLYVVVLYVLVITAMNNVMTFNQQDYELIHMAECIYGLAVYISDVTVLCAVCNNGGPQHVGDWCKLHF